MRQLLQETAGNKKAMEEKIKRLTIALSDIQQELWNTKKLTIFYWLNKVIKIIHCVLSQWLQPL